MAKLDATYINRLLYITPNNFIRYSKVMLADMVKAGKITIEEIECKLLKGGKNGNRA